MIDAKIQPEDAMLALESLISSKRAAFRKPLKIALAIAEHGTRVFDTRREDVAFEGWDDRADLSIFSNARTISDLLLGEFDPAAPKKEHLFLWAGDESDWKVLINALSGAASMLDIRARSATKVGKRKRG
jgi:hypothetical protein